MRVCSQGSGSDFLLVCCDAAKSYEITDVSEGEHHKIIRGSLEDMSAETVAHSFRS
jgi:hypothetical protein